MKGTVHHDGFPHLLRGSCEKAVSLDENYIVKLNGSKSNRLALTVTNSGGEVYSFDGGDLRKIYSLPKTENDSTDIKFSPSNDELVYSSSAGGTIKLWDLREDAKPVREFKENDEKKTSAKPIGCFDISCDDRILCGATDLVEDDAFMLFWDLRGKELLGAYWESHTDDIVQVLFSEDERDRLATAGADGLMNVFDISESCEDDALQYSLNVDCAVDKICWVSDKILGCTTQNVEVQFWDVETADRIMEFNRKTLTESIMGIDVDDSYLVDIFRSKENDPFILAGSYADDGKCLRMLKVVDKNLSKLASLEKNKQVTRCGWYDAKGDILFTGGEAGILTVWKPDDAEVTVDKNLSKTSRTEKLKARKKKPYEK